MNHIARSERVLLAACNRLSANLTRLFGMLIHQLLSAGNFDPDVYPDPLRFDVRRDPKNILTFGAGAHNCIAARLARAMMTRAVMSLINLIADGAMSEQHWDRVHLTAERLRRGSDGSDILSDRPHQRFDAAQRPAR